MQTARERQARAEERKALETGAALYQDELLPGFYDEWIKPKREQLHQQLLRTLQRFMELLQEAAEAAAATSYAERRVTLDPLRENHYRFLMELQSVNPPERESC